MIYGNPFLTSTIGSLLTVIIYMLMFQKIFSRIE